MWHENLTEIVISENRRQAIRFLVEEYADKLIEKYYGYLLDVDLRNGVALLKMINRLDDEFYFEDQRCGECCIDTPALSPQELSRLAGYHEMSADDFYGKYCRKELMGGLTEYPYLSVRLGKKNGRCVFNGMKDGKPHCNVYDERPGSCRLLPMKIIPNEMVVVKDDGASFFPQDCSLNTLVDISNFYVAICDAIFGGENHRVGDWLDRNGGFTYLQEFVGHHIENWEYFMEDKSPGKIARAENALKRCFNLSKV